MTLIKRYFGEFGGMYVPEMMVPTMLALERAYVNAIADESFVKELRYYLNSFAGRPTSLFFAKNFSKRVGCKVYLKREDLLHTGAHKINNAIGQALLAKRMGKKEIIAETGAGQHGVATAVVGALLGIPVKVFMGSVDMERQKLNVYRMKLFGAQVIPVESGSKTLKEAVNEALRYFLANVENSYYLLGSAVGPHPYPTMVEYFQKVIGEEIKSQILVAEKKLPTHVVACVGGGSNAIGTFAPFIDDAEVALIGVEAAGTGNLSSNSHEHCLTLSKGSVGIFQGSKSFLLQNKDGQISDTHSISAGLDYPGVGPHHSFLHASGRATYIGITDKQALIGLQALCREEGILPALESSHAVAYVLENKQLFKSTDIVVITISGRGDKDVHSIMAALPEEKL